jgi:hypothetical protein
MKRTLLALGILVGALTIATAPAQVVYSFEEPNLHGFAGSGGGGWLVFQESQIGVTHGEYSMGVHWPPTDSGDSRWLLGNGVREELLPYLRISKKLLLDATAGANVEWSNMVVSLNGGYPTGDPRSYGWNELRFSTALPSAQGTTRTVLLDLESLPLPDPDIEWFQINFFLNAGDPHQLYFDNMRLYRTACEMMAMDFDTPGELYGFAPASNDTGVTVLWNNGKMRIVSQGGFHWIFNGTVPGLLEMLQRGDLLVMDVTVVSPPSDDGWGNMIIAVNSGPTGQSGTWSQASYTAEIAAGNNTFTRTIAIDYRDVTYHNPADYCLVNLGINSKPGDAWTIEVDNIRIYRKAVEGDVNCDGCVDDADLLSVLFEFGSTDITPADVNNDRTVDDADLLTVLFNFGTGC